MTFPVRAELLKVRTARGTAGLLAAMVLLVSAVVLVHGFANQAGHVDATDEMHVFGWGQLGTVFAAILGALSITGELRQGTIRPTFLITPRRSRVLLAKLVAVALTGAMLGAAAELLAIGLGGAVLSARSIPLKLDGGSYVQLVVGGAAAATLLAALGLGAGALIRNQVATLVALCAWLLFVETVVVGQLPEALPFFPALLLFVWVTSGLAVVGRGHRG